MQRRWFSTESGEQQMCAPRAEASSARNAGSESARRLRMRSSGATAFRGAPRHSQPCLPSMLIRNRRG
eukprot:8966730-Pyramimonas_sp.AAC.1